MAAVRSRASMCRACARNGAGARYYSVNGLRGLTSETSQFLRFRRRRTDEESAPRGEGQGKQAGHRGRPVNSVRLGGVYREAVAGGDAGTRNAIPGLQRAHARAERARDGRKSVATLDPIGD